MHRITTLIALIALLGWTPGSSLAGKPNLKLEGISVSEVAASGDECAHEMVTIPQPKNKMLAQWMQGRWGTFAREEAALMPAVYADAGLRRTMVGVPLAGIGSQRKYRRDAWKILSLHTDDESIMDLDKAEFMSALDELPSLSRDEKRQLAQIHNPAGFNKWGLAVQRQGWRALDPLMEEVTSLNPPILDVWFWNLAGYDHKVVKPEGAHNTAMGWPSMRFLRPDLRESFPAWRQKWNDRGVRFGAWASTLAYPNSGTLAEPVRRWPRWKNPDGSLYVMDRSDPNAPADIDWIVEELKPLSTDMGFDFVGLDAVNHLLTRRDEPSRGAIRYRHASGPRESGIMLEIQRRLVSDIPGAQFVTEGHFPPTEHHALMPTFFIIQGDTYTGGQALMSEIGDEQHRYIIPGCEVLAHCIGDKWTDEQWPPGQWPGPVLQELRRRGYTPCVNIFALEDRVLKPKRQQAHKHRKQQSKSGR